jgi:hypothetical protein
MISFKRKQLFGLACDRNHSILLRADKTKGPSLSSIVAKTDSPVEANVTFPRLLSSAGNVKGDVNIVLPLEYFEVVTINIPKIPEASVGKTIPYHLAKVLDKPISHFIYDWQITHRLKENFKITIYLYPAEEFKRLRTELHKHQLEVTHLEPDIFSALSYLDQEKRIPAHEPVICVLLWKSSISLAVYNKNLVVMVRTIMLNQPTEETPLHIEKTALDTSEETDLKKKNEPDLTFYTDSDDSEASILDDFNLSISSNDNSAPAQKEQITVPPSFTEEKKSKSESHSITWQKYLAEVNLEIMRTRDFYSSVLKGGSVELVIVGGGEKDWDKLQESLSKLSDFKIEQLFRDPPSLPCSPLLAAVGQGTLSGWS